MEDCFRSKKQNAHSHSHSHFNSSKSWLPVFPVVETLLLLLKNADGRCAGAGWMDGDFMLLSRFVWGRGICVVERG